jgi:hypothetical protein
MHNGVSLVGYHGKLCSQEFCVAIVVFTVHRHFRTLSLLGYHGTHSRACSRRQDSARTACHYSLGAPKEETNSKYFV